MLPTRSKTPNESNSPNLSWGGGVIFSLGYDYIKYHKIFRICYQTDGFGVLTCSNCTRVIIPAAFTLQPVSAPSAVIGQQSIHWGWSLGCFLCWHWAVTLSHVERLGIEKCHGCHRQKVWNMQWGQWQEGAHGKKTPWTNATAPTAKWNPFRAAWCFIIIMIHDDHHDEPSL